MSTKKRKYYRQEPVSEKIFIVRYKDSTVGEIHNEGPYNDVDVATEKLNALLKRGVCSWVVSYKGASRDG